MNHSEIRNYDEFRRWVKIRLVEVELSQRKLAQQMGIPHARISEAIHGKQTGKKYIIPIIENLGGEIEDFHEFLEMVAGKTVDKRIIKTWLSMFWSLAVYPHLIGISMLY